jgi:hypothetical protein
MSNDSNVPPTKDEFTLDGLIENYRLETYAPDKNLFERAIMRRLAFEARTLGRQIEAMGQAMASEATRA